MSTALDSRYGKRKERKKLPTAFWVATAVLACFLSAAFGWWVQVSDSTASPSHKDIGHRVISADEVSLTFEVVKQPEATAVCALKALNSDRAPVGWTEVTIGPNTAEENNTTVRQQTVIFRSLEEATAVTVDRCWGITG